ncbi:hypothetical protein H9P43_002079 [Blastocladiella emersonii ATCC 22665]|nr:hypothetical protein H9P43_002079 [Blastocladiella emersonii ATCC 22665]
MHLSSTRAAPRRSKPARLPVLAALVLALLVLVASPATDASPLSTARFLRNLPDAPSTVPFLSRANAAALRVGAWLTSPVDGAAFRYQRALTGGSGAFQFDLTCDAPAGTPSTGLGVCATAEKALQRAAARLASEWAFRRTVRVAVSLFLPKPDSATTLGVANPSARFPVRHRDDKAVYLYPTALLKQGDWPEIDKGQVEWPSYDILAQFNSARDWWVADAGAPIAQTQRDLELVMTHELLHGLGLGDDTLMATPVTSQTPLRLAPLWDSTPASVQPPPMDTPSQLTWAGDDFYRFTAPSIWNRFTVLDGRPVAARTAPLAAAFTRLTQSGKLTSTSTSGRTEGNVRYAAVDVLNALLADKPSEALMADLGKLATTPGALVFDAAAWPPSAARVSGVPRIQLETAAAYSAGTSLVHLAASASADGPDFLMTGRVRTGTDFNATIGALRAPASGIGPLAKAMVTALGYTPRPAAGKSVQYTEFAKHADLLPEALREPSATRAVPGAPDDAAAGSTSQAKSVPGSSGDKADGTQKASSPTSAAAGSRGSVKVWTAILVLAVMAIASS